MIPCLALNRKGAVPMNGVTDAWFDVEVAGCSLADERLNKRLRKLLAQRTPPPKLSITHIFSADHCTQCDVGQPR